MSKNTKSISPTRNLYNEFNYHTDWKRRVNKELDGKLV